MKFNFNTSFNEYYITGNHAKTIFVIPIIFTVIILAILVIPTTSKFGFWLLDENHPIEILTFIVFFIGGFYGINLSMKLFKSQEKFSSIFYLLFSLGLIFLAMEEIAWGQWFFHFETPDAWKQINERDETTIHNLKGIQGNTEILRLTYGVMGLIGIFFCAFEKLKKICFPKLLLLWLLIIIFHASIDFYADIYIGKVSKKTDLILQESSEFIELLIASSSFLYLWLNFRVLKFDKVIND